MQSGTIKCTHDFYLKFFHIGLATGIITFPNFDIILLDEAGDLNAVTLEIFRLLPATRKIAVGDGFQNVYAFNHTINCFKLLNSEGTTFHMTQSFRVADYIAKGIQQFCRTTLDPRFSFKGIPMPVKPPIKTRAYIARTNSSLVTKMIQLNQLGIPYKLTRTPYQIFQLPLVICTILCNKVITDPMYAHLQDDIDLYLKDETLRNQFKSRIAFISSIYKDDVQLSTAISTVMRHGVEAIIECYESSRKYLKTNCSLSLGTSHSVKGLEFCEVEIDDDLNQVVAPILDYIADGNEPSEAQISELNLYYVAVSRCRVSLINAQHISLT